MFSLDDVLAFFRWLTGSDQDQLQPLYIPIEEEQKRER